MPTTYTHQLASGVSRTTGIAAQTLNTLCHFAGDEINNSVNKDEFLDLVVSMEVVASPVAGAPVNVHILYAIDGTNYEDGIPATNDGTAAAAPAPNGGSIVNSHGMLANGDAQKWTVREVPLLPYKFRIVVYNGTTKNAETTKLTVLAYGRKSETIAP